MPHPPVFLLGPARSGTTLLYKTLCLHPDAGYLSNWVRRFPTLPQAGVMNRVARHLPRQRRHCWFDTSSNAYVYGAPRSPMNRMFPAPVEGEPIFTVCSISQAPGGRAGDVQPDLDRLRRSFEVVLRSGAGTVLINKRIANNSRIPLLLEAFPQARFVSLVRDGRAVALSLSKVDWWEDSVLPWYGGTPRQWVAGGGDPWELCARNWVEDLKQIDAGLSTVPRHQQLRLSYEEFLREPMNVLTAAAGFAGLDADEGRWRRELRVLRFPDGNQRWRNDMPEAAQARVTELQRPYLARLGYL